jgi:hypothetical protein
LANDPKCEGFGNRSGKAERPDGKVIPGPHYNLDGVRGLVATANVHRKRARDAVVRFLDCSEREAERYIRQELYKLERRHYKETREMPDEWVPPGLKLDVYLYANEDTCWYVKFGVYEGRIELISFHKEGDYK